MSMLRMPVSLAAALMFITVPACSGDDDAPAGEQTPDAGGDEEEEVPCGDKYPNVAPGLTVKSGDLTVKLVSADPAPARQFVNNDWILQVLDAAGQPVTDFEVTDAVSFMVVHNHYGMPDPVIMKQSEPGQFKLDNIKFRMRGPWDVIFQLSQAGKKNLTTFKICVE